jgi:hypothetical protein
MLLMVAFVKSNLRRTQVQNSTLDATRSPWAEAGLNCERRITAPSNNFSINLKLGNLYAALEGETGADARGGASWCMRRRRGRSFL